MSIKEGEHVGIPLFDDFLALWSAWQKGRNGAPEWSRFHPLEHPYLLPHVMLYKRMDERFYCTIVGEQANACIPIKLANRFIDEAMPASNLADVVTRLTAALETGRPNFVEKTMAWEPGHDLKSYSALQLPFSDRDDGNPRILSLMSFSSLRV
jgi:hypothetical protein